MDTIKRRNQTLDMCTSPTILKDRVVACNHCIECLIKRSQEWAFRLEEEAKTATSGVFITLTYSPSNEIQVDTPEGVKTTLSKRDVQLFNKRLRKHHEKNRKITKDYRSKPRYFFNGEYGPSTDRAHYHAVIFNLPKCTIQALPEIWGKGFVKVGDVTPKSIRYVTNYMLLKDKEILEGQQKPFTLMSKKPILGANYVSNNYYHHHEHSDITLRNASKREKPLYRSLERQIFTDEEMLRNKKLRQERYAEFIQDMENDAIKNDPLDPEGHKRKVRKERNAKQIRFSNRKKRKL
mgnify:CR=1 FL=1